ncbi:MAG: hypothetical protein AAGC74_08850 [Verrucomicrobiota bacterium]
MAIIIRILWASACFLPSLHAAALSPGNLLVSSNEILYEMSPDGSIIQSFAIPYGSGLHPVTESARDIAMGRDGRVHVYNGTFDPYLSTLNPITGTWEHRSIPGWTTVNNGSYGGIDILGDQVFLTNMKTFGEVEDQRSGLVRFNLLTGQITFFAETIEPIDLTLGYDGLLYALFPGGSPEGSFIDVFDPMTLQPLRTISLADTFGHTGHRSIAADANGNVYVADWDGDVQIIDSSGNLIDTLPTLASHNDIALSTDGSLALSTRFNGIYTTDTNFSNPAPISTLENAFVAYIVPEPAAPSLLGLAILSILSKRSRP